MRQKIKIAFTDFWHGNSEADVSANPLFHLMSRYFDLKLSNNPDFLFYSCFGKKFLSYNCTRIFYTGENIRPNLNQCDYAFSFDYPVTARNYRLPLYHLYGYTELLRNRDPEASGLFNRKFCNFVYSNKKASKRIDFYDKLTRYKPIDSGGKVLNNIGGRVGDKLEFLRSYKFTIAFENSSHPGYTTEKIAEALLANTVPIYWGNPLAARDFNPESFINCHDFESFDHVIDYVAQVDNDESLYRRYISAPAFANGADNEFVNEENLTGQFERIFSGSTRSQVAKRYDPIKYWLHPQRPWFFATSVVRRRRYSQRKHRSVNS